MTLNITTATADYTFTLYPIDTKFNRIAVIYIFIIIPESLLCNRTPPLKGILCESKEGCKDTQHPSSSIHPYSLLYAGITNNLRGRFNQHHKIQQAKSLGMTHIGILKISSGRKRKKIEREILKYLNPPLNQTYLHNYS